MKSALAKIYASPKTVLTTQDIALLWGETDKYKLRNKIRYYVNRGSLLRLRGGVFAKDKDFNPQELATSIFTPSYISFETVLFDSGMISQFYETIYAASYKSQNVKCGGHSFAFRKIKDEVLYNPAGIINDGNISRATAERAFLDMIYLTPHYYFDNLRSLDWKKCRELVKIYLNNQLVRRFIAYQTKYAG